MAKHNPFSCDLTPDQAERALSGRELAQYHMGNPAGIMAEWASLGQRLIANGRGFAAYGDTGFYAEQMTRLAHQARVDRIELLSLIKCIRRTITMGEQFLASEAAERAA
jgi:hypothetical protein